MPSLSPNPHLPYNSNSYNPTITNLHQNIAACKSNRRRALRFSNPIPLHQLNSLLSTATAAPASAQSSSSVSAPASLSPTPRSSITLNQAPDLPRCFSDELVSLTRNQRRELYKLITENELLNQQSNNPPPSLYTCTTDITFSRCSSLMPILRSTYSIPELDYEDQSSDYSSRSNSPVSVSNSNNNNDNSSIIPITSTTNKRLVNKSRRQCLVFTVPADLSLRLQ